MANVLGINLSELAPEMVFEKIKGFLSGGGQHYLVTPNPEIILVAHRDEELFYILNKADLSLADGFGLKLAGWLAGAKIPRLTGADLTGDLLDLARAKKIKIAVLNWRGGLSEGTEIKSALTAKYPDLNFLILDASRSQPLASELINRINNFAPLILFNTFGSPYQEKIIYHNLAKWPSVKLALGVGGAFDFITGRAVRAPKFLRVIGLEWLWRLLTPTKGGGRKFKRWKRIYKATLVFIGKLLRARINHFFYRPNVACLLYKKDGDRIKILIVEREDESGHWQLPQGGTNNESLEKAGARETREELNTNKFITKATFKNVHRYLFPPVSEQGSLRLSNRFKYDNKGQRRGLYVSEFYPEPMRAYLYNYKGQKQGLYIAKFTGTDQDIKVNFWDHRAWKWVKEYEFVTKVHPIRQESAKIFLEKFKSLNL